MTGKLLLCIRRADFNKPVVNNQVHQHKSLQPLDQLDMSRVTSDALPHSLNATTVHLEREETPDFKNSTIIEVLSSPDKPIESDKDKFLSVETIDAYPSQSSTLHNTKNARPRSAPTKTVTSIVSVPAHKSHTLPNKRNSLFKQAKDRQIAEREKRTASIHNSAQILLKYAQNRQSSHSSSSLQADDQSPTRINKLFEKSTIKQQSSVENSECRDLSCSRHSSSSITMDECSSSSTPLNLRHISMDETRLASVMQMDSIWKQVESGDDSPSLSARHTSSLLFDRDEDEVPCSSEQTEYSNDLTEVLLSGGISILQPSCLPSNTSTATFTTSASPNLITSTPLTSSKPIPICTPTPSLSTPTPIAASTPLAQSMPLLYDVSVSKKNAETRQESTSFDNKGDSINFGHMYVMCMHSIHARNYALLNDKMWLL